MTSETIEVLLRLKRRLGRERARHERLFHEATDSFSRHCAFGEEAALQLAICFVSDEINKLKEGK